MFYVMYDTITGTAVGVSGSPFTEVIDSCATAPVRDADGISFIEGHRHLHNYFIIVKDGVGEFVPKGHEIISQTSRKLDKGFDSIKDLNYKTIFFDRLFIKYEITKDSIVLVTEQMPPEAVAYLRTMINETNGLCNIYITKLNDPTALLFRTTIDIYQLSLQGSHTIPFTDSYNISVWGSRETA